MLRITEQHADNSFVTLWLEGRLVGAWVAVLQTSCLAYLEQGQRLTLELANVSFADQAGLALLAELAQQDVTLCHASPFLQTQLNPAQTGPKQLTQRLSKLR